MRIALIVAMADNGVIGRDNRLPWHLPEDLKYFKQVTLGKPVIMGRKTYDSIGRPLPGRTNIVLTRQSGFQPAGVRVVHTLDEALLVATGQARADGAEEVMVMGGAAVYAEALPRADRLYLTRVLAAVEGDARFPLLDWSAWVLRSSEAHPAAGPSGYPYRFEVYDRCPA